MPGTKAPRRAARIIGLETEYGCLVGGLGPRAVAQVRDWIFENQRYGLIDRHDRDWDEGPGNGGFLFNGGRVYIDMGHIEYCTPECVSVTDVVRYDRAGDRLLLEAVQSLGLDSKVSFFRNNIDHQTGATFGCHENFSLLRAAPLTEANVLSLLTFLTLRVLFTGSGRVGAVDTLMDAGAPPVDFQMSQRADYIENDFYEWVQNNRAIINTRDEPLGDPRKYRRLHLIHGDTSVLPAALFLKVGATRLVLDLLEADDLPALALDSAVITLRLMSRQLQGPWRVELAGGQEADAVALLARYRERAQRRFGGRDAETDAILALWQRVEEGLASDLDSLVGVVDWVTKYRLLDTFRLSEKLAWTDPWLEAQDLEYHHIDPSRSLGLAMADLSGPWAVAADDPAPLEQGPANTRAGWRTAVMRGLAAASDQGGYEIDWDRINMPDAEPVLMPNPFQSQPDGRQPE